MRYLVRLTELELIDRERRMVERRIRMAKFPAVKSLDSFDFKAMPSLNKMMVLELARCEYIEPCLSGCNPHPLYVGCAVIRQARVSEWKLMF